jgi:Family of unknown function (DUF6502)
VKNISNQNAALVEFLEEFAKYMISSGVSLAEFQSAAKTAFLQAALGRARLRNSRVNQSALAAITGLNRSQVRALLHEWEDGPTPQSSRLSEVLDAWQFDPQFLSAAEAELRLPIRGDQGSFSALVQKYCGDVSYRALLAELKKLGYVRLQGADVILTQRGKEHSEPREIRQLSSGLAFALRNDVRTKTDVGVITAEAVYKTPSPKSRLLIKKRLVQSTKAFAADIRATGEAEASKALGKSDRKTRSSIFVLTVDQSE